MILHEPVAVPVVAIVKLEGVIRLKVGAVIDPVVVNVPVIVGATRMVGIGKNTSVGKLNPLQYV